MNRHVLHFSFNICLMKKTLLTEVRRVVDNTSRANGKKLVSILFTSLTASNQFLNNVICYQKHFVAYESNETEKNIATIHLWIQFFLSELHVILDFIDRLSKKNITIQFVVLKNVILFINRQQVRPYIRMLEFFNQFEKEYPRTIISFLYLLNSLGKF